jgi:molybdenum cofactor cytidylyltransferase
MEARHKLLETVADRPVIAWAVQAALRTGAEPVVVVTGHGASDVEAVLPAGAETVHNPDYATGLSSSLRVGLESLPPDVDAAAIALGDMPCVRAAHYRALFAAWTPGAIVVPTWAGRLGNPVLWSAEFFSAMCALGGDRGARSMLEDHREAVRELPARDDAVLIDVDDRSDLQRARQRVARPTSPE